MFGRHGIFIGKFGRGPFQKGDLKYIILDLIKDKPRYGYEIIRELESRSHGFYAPSPGAVYPTLQMLEEMGYLTATQQDGKKVYTITDEGRRFLSERRGLADEIKDQVRLHWELKNVEEFAEMMREFGRFGPLLALRLRRADTAKVRRVRDVLSRAMSEIEAILEEREVPGQSKPSES